MTKKEGEEQDILLRQVNKIFEKFDQKEKRLDQAAKKAEQIVDGLLQLFHTNQPIFKVPGVFLEGMAQLSKVEGYLQHTVIDIELQRERIRKPFQFLEQEQEQKAIEQSKMPTPVVVSAAAPVESSGPGFWGGMWNYASQRIRTKMLEKQFEKGPIITTTQKPRDILDYCRDITREHNKLIDYFQACLDTLELFPNNKRTEDFYYAEIRSYLHKLSNIIKTFTLANAEYRKELLGEREEAYARAITSLEEARYMMQQGGRGFSLDRLAEEMRGGVRS